LVRYYKLGSTYTDRWGARAILQSKDFIYVGGSVASSVNSDAFTPLIARMSSVGVLDTAYELRDTSAVAPWYAIDLIGFGTYQMKYRNGIVEYFMNATPRDANFLPMGDHLPYLFINFRPGPNDRNKHKWGTSCDDVHVLRWWPQGTGVRSKFLIP